MSNEAAPTAGEREGAPDPTDPTDPRVPSFQRVSHIDFDSDRPATPPADAASEVEGGLRKRILLALAQADGQPWKSIADAPEHTAEFMYGKQADVMEQIIADHKASFRSHDPLASTDASEGLSEAERAAVYFEVCPDLTHTMADGHDRCEEQAERVIAIVAARESAAATRARAEGAAEAWDEGAQAATDWIKVGAWIATMPDNPYRADTLARSDAAPHTGGSDV